MTRNTTKAEREREDRIRSMKLFGLAMADAPAAPKTTGPVFTLDTETTRRWELVKAAR